MSIKEKLIEPNTIPAGFYTREQVSNESNTIYTVNIYRTAKFSYTEVGFPYTRRAFYLVGEVYPSASDVFSLLTGIQILALLMRVEELAFEKGAKAKQQELLDVLGIR